MKRKNSDWIGGFLSYSDSITSPELFRKWSAISTVASALQRRCYSHIVGRRQYPNLYVLLVAPPGVGKTASIFSAREIAAKFKNIKLTPTRITPQALYIEFEEAVQSVSHLGDSTKPIIDTHSSLTAMIDELGTFVKKGDIEFMADLTDYFDCPDPLRYKTKNSGDYFINATWFNFIAGCTPYTLKETFSNEAIEMGFPARCILVFSNTVVKHQSLFDAPLVGQHGATQGSSLFADLASDLEQILALSGEFIWTPEARDFLNSWYKDNLRPYPNDPKLEHYCTRRLTHVTKLAMVFSASRASDLTVDLSDIRRAKESLLEVEQVMDKATQAVGGNVYYQAQLNILKFVEAFHERGEPAVPEATIRRYMARDVPPYLADQMIDQLVSQQHLVAVNTNTAPDRVFKLAERKKNDSR